MRAVSTPNIALIKYWGNRREDWRLPAADSLSITLDRPNVEVDVQPSDAFAVRSFDLAGNENPQSEKSVERLKKHWDLTCAYGESIVHAGIMPKRVSLDIRSSIPPSIGIASSAAVFSCLAEAYAGLMGGTKHLTREQVSVIGRLGSGSAARSAMGGFVALENVGGDRMDAARARQIAPASHWTLHDIIIVPSREEKKVGSTEGHALAATSPLFTARLKEIPRRMKECIAAIEAKDFEKLRVISEEDSLDMHRVMQSQNPPLQYLSDDTHRILREIEALRTNDHLEVLYTMDAGPTVHLICTETSRNAIIAFAESQKNCTVFKASAGGGSTIV